MLGFAKEGSISDGVYGTKVSKTIKILVLPSRVFICDGSSLFKGVLETLKGKKVRFYVNLYFPNDKAKLERRKIFCKSAVPNEDEINLEFMNNL